MNPVWEVEVFGCSAGSAGLDTGHNRALQDHKRQLFEALHRLGSCRVLECHDNAPSATSAAWIFSGLVSCVGFNIRRTTVSLFSEALGKFGVRYAAFPHGEV